MKVALYPSDRSGCSFCRIQEPARTAGVEVVHCGVELTVETRLYDDGRMVDVPADMDADVFVISRPCSIQNLSLVRWWKSQGHAVVVDLDDDFSVLPPGHINQQAFETDSCHWRFLQAACQIADLVTVTTPALAERFAPHGRFLILPNCVPQALLEMPRFSDGRTLGWSGVRATHPGDLEVVGTGVREALERSGWHFRTIGNPEGVAQALGLGEVQSTSMLSPEDCHRALGALDVGIAPLAANRFNRSKSYLKPLEYAARGVPCVMSESPAYVKLARQGIGTLVESHSDRWRTALLWLMGDDGRRDEAVAYAREVVAQHHTYERNGWRWAEAWEAALANSKRREAVLA